MVGVIKNKIPTVVIGSSLAPALNRASGITVTAPAKNNKIFAMDGMKMLGFGPRTIGAALELAQKIQ